MNLSNGAYIVPFNGQLEAVHKWLLFKLNLPPLENFTLTPWKLPKLWWKIEINVSTYTPIFSATILRNTQVIYITIIFILVWKMSGLRTFSAHRIKKYSLRAVRPHGYLWGRSSTSWRRMHADRSPHHLNRCVPARCS